MSLKKLLDLEGEDITEDEILAKIKDAQKNNTDTIEITKKDGSKVTIRIPRIVFEHVTRLGE